MGTKTVHTVQRNRIVSDRDKGRNMVPLDPETLIADSCFPALTDVISRNGKIPSHEATAVNRDLLSLLLEAILMFMLRLPMSQ